MRVVYESGASETVAFAASELADYLKKMVYDLPEDDWKIQLKTDRNGELPAQSKNDCYRVRISESGGAITGNNDRSVLLGVYDYLHHLGCRFLLPLKAGEYIPCIGREKLMADYTKQASFYHRGVCIEGADSLENILDFIDWLPKVGYNSFFLQFKVPYAFLSRWYHHEQNPYREAERFTYEDACACMGRLEAEMKKRGLMLHKVGHGWTGEVLGYQTASWNPVEETSSLQTERFAAEVGGVRGLYKGVPANTNLCYHSSEAIDIFASKAVKYAEENPQVDYLHIWLADEYNNVCECADCRKTTVSDQYVSLLNEIDRRLSEKKLDTRLVFLLYQELLWPPVKERLANPDRFVLMFAPISRTFEASYSLENIPENLPDYVRNQIVLPVSLGENLAYLKGWQRQFKGDSFIYDYPLGRAHYGDFGYVHISGVISGDIKKLKKMGLDGYISCQELRAAFPNALPNYIMGYTLFSETADPEKIMDEYFSAAYGERAPQVKAYLESLSESGSCDYINGKGERVNGRMAERMQAIRQCCEAFWAEQDALEAGDMHSGNVRDLFWNVLKYHKDYVMQISEAVLLLASGEQKAAMKKWSDMRKLICDGEDKFQPYLDVYRVLEVTQKYTGFR